MFLPQKDRNRHAETWQRLADIRVSIPNRGCEMLEQISASDADPQTRNALARECDNLRAKRLAGRTAHTRRNS